MSFTKTKIYNLALSHLLLARQVTETETDTITNEVRILNTFWDDAFSLTLEDLDLDSLSEPITLELLDNLNGCPWLYAYQYPTRCNFFRRIVSGAIIDTSSTHIPKRSGQYNGQKAIFTNKEKAVAECIPKDISLETISSSTGLAISYQLAALCAPLLVGKGAKKLIESTNAQYKIMKEKAQEIDSLENYNFDQPEERSEYVAARIS